MKCTIEIKMDNAAFIDNSPQVEAARILSGVCAKLLRVPMADIDNLYLVLKDYNGNTVGSLKIED